MLYMDITENMLPLLFLRVRSVLQLIQMTAGFRKQALHALPL